MNKKSFLFTSESVSEGPPDKVADQVSDAVLDAIIEKDPKARVACETLVTTGYTVVAGEISTNCYIEIPQIVRNTIKNIGYSHSGMGFDLETFILNFFTLINLGGAICSAVILYKYE